MNHVNCYIAGEILVALLLFIIIRMTYIRRAPTVIAMRMAILTSVCVSDETRSKLEPMVSSTCQPSCL